MSNLTVLDFPIEPIEDRYSIQWYKWFGEAFQRNDIDYTHINGDMTKIYEVAPGEFLNPTLTFDWKFKQLQSACNYLDSLLPSFRIGGTVVCFLHDAWFPGIESLKYVAEMGGINLKIVGFWHAGSYLSNDLLGIKGFNEWALGSEMTWFSLCDAVCVGSNYHRDRILAALGAVDSDADKVHVTGYPIEVPNIKCKKEDIVVWPHRIAEDKHPEIFDKLASDLAHSGWKFIKSKEVCETKNEYYRLLARSKVAISTATMETFGIAMAEAQALSCFCLVPNTLCYPEFYPQWTYKDYEDLLQTVTRCMVPDVHPSLNDIDEMKKRFSVEKVTDLICEIIQEVASNG